MKHRTAIYCNITVAVMVLQILPAGLLISLLISNIIIFRISHCILLVPCDQRCQWVLLSCFQSISKMHFCMLSNNYEVKLYFMKMQFESLVNYTGSWKLCLVMRYLTFHVFFKVHINMFFKMELFAIFVKNCYYLINSRCTG